MKFVKCQENETITMSLERYFEMLNEIELINDFRLKLRNVKNKPTKEQAENIMDSFRIKIGNYIGDDPNKVKIVD